MLQHYILIRYVAGTPNKHIREFCQRMLMLEDEIDLIKSISVARDILNEERSWDVILDLTFEDVESLRCYQQHASHLALMDFNRLYVQDVAAMDFFESEKIEQG